MIRLCYNIVMRMRRNISLHIFFIAILLVSLSSCKNSKKAAFRYDLSDKVEYLETPSYYNIGNIMRERENFKPLDKAKFKSLNALLENKDNYIWLKIDFEVPDLLKSKGLGVYVDQLNSADQYFFNGTGLRVYGSFAPNYMSAGFQAQFVMLPFTLIKQNGVNTLLIQVSTDSSVSMSEKIFIGEANDIFTTAELKSFLCSRINMTFAAMMIIIFLIFFLFWIKLFKYDESKMFFSFSMLLLYTIHFLIPFFIAEIPWAKPTFISYTTFIKFFFGFGTFTTIYFANSFIIHYLGYKESKKIIILRFVLWLLPTFSLVFINELEIIKRSIPVYILLCTVQFFFSIPRFFIAFKDSARRNTAFLLLEGFSPALLGIIADFIFKIIFGLRALPYFSIYGWQLTVIIFLVFLVQKFSKLYRHNYELKNQLVDFNTNLENIVAMRTKEVAEANFILSRGLETISHVQQNFLPPQNKTLKGWELAISYKALDHDVSGDLYDYYYTENNLDGLGIFDVSGHGIPAGLMTILAKGIISQHFTNGVANAESMSAVLKEINKSYIKEKVDVENYITGLLFQFSDFNKKDICSVEVANAGHPYPLLYSNESQSVSELKYEGSENQFGLIGIEDYEVSFPPVSLRMGPYDILVSYTDGLTEAINTNGEEFGLPRLIKILEENHDKNADELKKIIMEELKQFIGEEKIHDDITLIVLKRLPSSDFVEEL